MPSATRKRSAGASPWRDGVSTYAGLRACAFWPETRAPACAGASWVDRYVSPNLLQRTAYYNTAPGAQQRPDALRRSADPTCLSPVPCCEQPVGNPPFCPHSAPSPCRRVVTHHPATDLRRSSYSQTVRRYPQSSPHLWITARIGPQQGFGQEATERGKPAKIPKPSSSRPALSTGMPRR